MVISRYNRNGFTLIEVIVSMVILGILGSLSFVGVARLVQGYFFTVSNISLAQKAELTMLKLKKELNAICVPPSTGCQIPTATAYSLTFSSYRNSPTAGTHVLSWDQDGSHALLFDNDAVLGGSTNDYINFTLSYLDLYNSTPQSTWSSTRKIIQIQVGIRGADNAMHTFTDRVRPRNL